MFWALAEWSAWREMSSTREQPVKISSWLCQETSPRRIYQSCHGLSWVWSTHAIQFLAKFYTQEATCEANDKEMRIQIPAERRGIRSKVSHETCRVLSLHNWRGDLVVVKRGHWRNPQTNKLIFHGYKMCPRKKCVSVNKNVMWINGPPLVIIIEINIDLSVTERELTKAALGNNIFLVYISIYDIWFMIYDLWNMIYDIIYYHTFVCMIST